MSEPPVVVADRVILPIVAAAALVARQRRGYDGVGDVEEEPQLHRLHELRVEHLSPVVDADQTVPLPKP